MASLNQNYLIFFLSNPYTIPVLLSLMTNLLLLLPARHMLLWLVPGKGGGIVYPLVPGRYGIDIWRLLRVLLTLCFYVVFCYLLVLVFVCFYYCLCDLVCMLHPMSIVSVFKVMYVIYCLLGCLFIGFFLGSCWVLGKIFWLSIFDLDGCRMNSFSLLSWVYFFIVV